MKDFNKRKVLATIAILFLGAFALFAVKMLLESRGRLDRNQAAFALFKTRCREAAGSPYVDAEASFRFEFRPDQVACLHRDALAGVHEVYVWDREAFQSDSRRIFDGALLAKVSVDGSEGLKPVDVVASASGTVAGAGVTVETVRSQGCTDGSCPTARRAVMEHEGRRYILEEYSERSDLFRSFNLSP